MRLIVSGDRHGYSPYRVAEVLKRLYDSYDQLTILEGCAPGVDTQVTQWCRSMGAIERDGRKRLALKGSAAETIDRFELEHWPAEWALHGGGCWCPEGKARCNFAGHRRNLEMLRSGGVEAVVTFHEYIANSKGTKHMAEAAENAEVKVLYIGSTL